MHTCVRINFFTNIASYVLFNNMKFFNKFIFIYLLLAASGLRCCAWAFSSCDKRGLLFVAVHGILIVVASRCETRALGAWTSVVVERGLSSCGLLALEHRLSTCGSQA